MTPLNGTVAPGREHRIRADLAHLKGARDFAEGAARGLGLSPSECYRVKLAIGEAVANAIQHGSRSAEDLVTIVVRQEAGTLVFEVVDTGRFVPRVVRGDLPERGRGLEFMRLMMDEVDVQPGAGGTRLRLVKRLA